MIIERVVSIEELDNFALFKVYYDRMMCLELNDKITKSLNDIMDHHFVQVYGEEYQADVDIVSHDFKCVYEIEKE